MYYSYFSFMVFVLLPLPTLQCSYHKVQKLSGICFPKCKQNISLFFIKHFLRTDLSLKSKKVKSGLKCKQAGYSISKRRRPGKKEKKLMFQSHFVYFNGK